MTWEQLSQGNNYLNASTRSKSLRNLVSRIVYCPEKGDGIDVKITIEPLNPEEREYFNDNELTQFFCCDTKTNENAETSTDILRHVMGAMERSADYFTKKIEEI